MGFQAVDFQCGGTERQLCWLLLIAIPDPNLGLSFSFQVKSFSVGGTSGIVNDMNNWTRPAGCQTLVGYVICSHESYSVLVPTPY